MATPSWQDFMDAYNSASQDYSSKHDSGSLQSMYMPGYGDVTVTPDNGSGSMAFNAAIPGDKQHAMVYTPDGEGGIKGEKAKYGTSWFDTVEPGTLAKIAASLIAGGMISGFGGLGAGAGATEGAGAAGLAGGMTGPMDLGGVLGGVEGAGGATGLGSAFGLGDASLGGTLAGSALSPTDLAEYSNEGLHYATPGSTVNSPINANAPDLNLSDLPNSDYSNEGRNYPTQESTANSPINSTSQPGVPTDAMRKIAQKLLSSAMQSGAGSGGIGQSGGALSSGATGLSGLPTNYTPKVSAALASQTQQQQTPQTTLLQNYQQPQFTPGGYMQISPGVTQNAQMLQLAKALQQHSEES